MDPGGIFTKHLSATPTGKQSGLILTLALCCADKKIPPCFICIELDETMELRLEDAGLKAGL